MSGLFLRSRIAPSFSLLLYLQSHFAGAFVSPSSCFAATSGQGIRKGTTHGKSAWQVAHHFTLRGSSFEIAKNKISNVAPLLERSYSWDNRYGKPDEPPTYRESDYAGSYFDNKYFYPNNESKAKLFGDRFFFLVDHARCA